MINGKLMGGLGNQLFIYAFCKELVSKTKQNAKLVFPESYRNLKLDKFKLDNRINIIKGEFENNIDDREVLRRYRLFSGLIEKINNTFLKKKLLIFRLKEELYIYWMVIDSYQLKKWKNTKK